MPGRGARVRTESMIQRLSKKPLSDGYELWDKGYILGALRLFQCKLEACPPFEMAPCTDAVATILEIIEEVDEAVEHYDQAADKYDTINKKVLGCLMRAKSAEAKGDLEVALKLCNEGLVDHDKGVDIAANQKFQFGRLLMTRADLYAKKGDFDAGLKDVTAAIGLEPGFVKAGDAVHLAHYNKGQIHQQLEQFDAADKAFTAAVTARPEHFASWEALCPIKKELGDLPGALDAIDKAYAVHGKSELVRDKAFLLSEMGKDDEALQVCDKAIENPPHAETEALSGPAESVAILHKAKAAILADAGKMDEAVKALKDALKCDPNDQETMRMSADITTTLARDYLQQNNIPQFLDALIGHVLQSKPDAPVAFMLEAIEKGAISVP